ncbi:MAG: AAA family ATPase [Rubricella sp.]
MALLKRAQAPQAEALVVWAVGEDFELLGEDLDAEFGDGWQALDLAKATDLIGRADPEVTEFVVVAVSQEDEADLAPFTGAIQAAKARGLSVLLVVDELSARGLHALMRAGADEFSPYPLPEGVFSETVTQIRRKAVSRPAAPQTGGGGSDRSGIVIPIYGVAGGVGSTTFAVNFAWEMVQILRKKDKRILLIDLDIQYGTASTFLELQRRDSVFELLSAPENLDGEALEQAIQPYKGKLDVLTAPPEALPLEFVERDTVERLLEVAMQSYDYVIVDMPTALCSWSDVLLRRADTYLVLMELDMRCADNMLRFLRALKAEDLPFEKIQYIVNRVPTGFDLSGRKSRMKRLAETLGVELNIALPDGGQAVADACDHGAPLAEAAARNPLRKEIRKSAEELLSLIENRTTEQI